MNILMLLSQHALTGAEVYAVTVAEELIRRGHRVWIVSDTLTTATKASFIQAPVRRKSLFARARLILWLRRFVKQNRIQVIHSHSRASAWVGQLAAGLCRIPHVVTVHGRQHLHISRRLIPAMGDATIAVCEVLKTHLERDLHVNSNRVELIRNPVHIEAGLALTGSNPARSTISLIGRLDGPKGDVAFILLKRIIQDSSIIAEINVIGGTSIPDRFQQFADRVRFIGQVPGIAEWVLKSDVVIGAGRVAVEAILLGCPVVAVGEGCALGLVTSENLPEALATNFGDVSENPRFEWDQLVADIVTGLCARRIDEQVVNEIQKAYDRGRIVNRIEQLYEHVLVMKRRYEIPVLCYHRVIADSDPRRGHGIWVTASQFEAHLSYLKRVGFHPITFAQLKSVNRLDRRERYIILTFDDGYADNYDIAFPLLRKYGFTAVIFPVLGLKDNAWDTAGDPGQPGLPLLNREQIQEMAAFGIEFGSHAMTHRSLPSLTAAEIAAEMTQSKAELEQIVGREVDVIAYPYGEYNDAVKQAAAQSGFRYGVTTDHGPVAISDDLFAIRRIIVFPNTTTYRLARKVRGDYAFRQTARESASSRSATPERHSQ
ncbi:MAG: polysaccharide deacetylase family protein [candidate division Zixibacteria bacterium]|nr:polysaccharide deacetylase family protein [candidate division Zixibacteria bacterium]